VPLYVFRGKRPVVAPDAWIAPTASLIGDVEVRSGASVWFGATLRGDMDRIVIGERTSVQDNCVIHADPGEPTIVGAGCTLGNVMIGSAAVLVGRNKVGPGTIVAAGAVLPEGMEIEGGKLVVGVPARVVRDMRPEDTARLPRAAAHYTELGAEYRERVREAPG
jgi:carbonic anhydrase/acetyltransferase-like protein (isoleucine patch superfamily)